MSLDELVRSATSRAGIIRVRNVLNPLLWLCAATTPVSFLFADLLGGDAILRYTPVGLGSLPVAVGLAAYTYFMLKDPNRLQSDDFVLRQQELTIVERKHAPPFPLNLDLTDEPLMATKRSSSHLEADRK